jgi:hypothetical protein
MAALTIAAFPLRNEEIIRRIREIVRLHVRWLDDVQITQALQEIILAFPAGIVVLKLKKLITPAKPMVLKQGLVTVLTLKENQFRQKFPGGQGRVIGILATVLQAKTVPAIPLE